MFLWVLWDLANKPKDGRLWATPICSQVGQKFWVTWAPGARDWHFVGGGSWDTEPFIWGVWGNSVTVRVELNHRTPSWYHRESPSWGKALHTWCQKCYVSSHVRVRRNKCVLPLYGQVFLYIIPTLKWCLPLYIWELAAAVEVAFKQNHTTS